jgi:hypothetical protein
MGFVKHTYANTAEGINGHWGPTLRSMPYLPRSGSFAACAGAPPLLFRALHQPLRRSFVFNHQTRVLKADKLCYRHFRIFVISSTTHNAALSGVETWSGHRWSRLLFQPFGGSGHCWIRWTTLCGRRMSRLRLSSPTRTRNGRRIVAPG